MNESRVSGYFFVMKTHSQSQKFQKVVKEHTVGGDTKDKNDMRQQITLFPHWQER